MVHVSQSSDLFLNDILPTKQAHLGKPACDGDRFGTYHANLHRSTKPIQLMYVDQRDVCMHEQELIN